MRFEVVKAIYEEALKNPRVYFMTGDLGHVNAEEFKKNIPQQYLNAGMAEQNMVGVAAGLAAQGMKVFVYSIVPFATLRCFEQIKIDMCYHDFDVTVIGVGAGFAYSTMGATHYAIEDIAALRALPHMQILSFANPASARALTRQFIEQRRGPAYFRLGKGGDPVYESDFTPTLSKGAVVRTGNDLSLISTGTILQEAMQAADLLEKKGMRAEVIDIHMIKPIDLPLIQETARQKKAVFTIEEHNVYGGLGSAVAEIISELPPDARPLFKRFGVPDLWPKTIGSIPYMRAQCGITAPQIADAIISSMA